MSKLPSLSFGKLEEEWSQYKLGEALIQVDGTDTKFKALFHNDKMIAIVKKGYKLLPNEEAAKLADQGAKLAGLVPFTQFSGPWIQRMHNHIIYDCDQTRVHCLYANNEPFDVNGDKMYIGVGIHNSIDGTLGFGCGIFTFRNACGNMVLAGTKSYVQAFDQRQTIEYIYRRHTSGLEIDGTLKNTIVSVMDRSQEIIFNYKQMAAEQVTKEFIEKLQRKHIPEKLLPDFLKAKTLDLTQATAKTQWDLYNDLTARIWHNQKTSLRTKTLQFAKVHAVLPLGAQ